MSNDATSGRLIVLDDELEIRNMLQRFLTAQGFTVRAVKNSVELEASLERHPFDLLILDVMMPGENGLAICRRLRAEGHTIPVLMLTARGDPVDKVLGLEIGADDYLAKPFLPSELVACIRAILRRQQYLMRLQNVRGGMLLAGEPEFLHFGSFRFDSQRHELWSKESGLIDLGSGEMRLLRALADTPNRPVSRANLIERAHGPGQEVSTRSVDVQILRLRQVIEADVSTPRHIRTVWGIGYMLVAEYRAGSNTSSA
jgi:DNA-binding response OmpR family regulator